MAPAPELLERLDASGDATSLSLAYASIGDEGCTALARYLRENVLLKTLDLRGNNIQADGLVVLAHALRSASSLVSLCLKWNHVGSQARGLQALCDALKRNDSISHLDLRNNKIGPECGRLLAEMLRENGALTHLDLSWNSFAEEGGKALLSGLRENRSLLDCQVNGNHMAEETLRSVDQVLQRNRQAQPHGTVSPRAPSSPSSKPADDGITAKLLQKQQNPNSSEEDARFFGEVAEYIDLLQLDVARNKKYRTDAEGKAKVEAKGLADRESRYAQELKELGVLVAKGKSETDDVLRERRQLDQDIARVRAERSKALQDHARLEDVSRAAATRLKADIHHSLTTKADLETQLYKVKRRQQEQEEENLRLRAYLAECKDDLDRALK